MTADVDTLIARQNEDGGWGADEGCESDTLEYEPRAARVESRQRQRANDVSLDGVNYPRSTHRTRTVAGRSRPARRARVFYTAYAVQALNSLRLQFGVSAFQTRALAYLRGRQNADGGYGAPSSTPFETRSEPAGDLRRRTAFDAPPRPAPSVSSTPRSNQTAVGPTMLTRPALALRALSFPQDTDADGMSDECETANGLNPNDPADAARDNDGDGLPNLEECRRRCLNPNNPDTDGDTLNDGDEVANGSDPCDASSRNRAPTITSQPVTTARERQALQLSGAGHRRRQRSACVLAAAVAQPE